jgi:hypothetical protein
MRVAQSILSVALAITTAALFLALLTAAFSSVARPPKVARAIAVGNISTCGYLRLAHYTKL